MAMIVFQRPFRVRPFALLFEGHFDCNEEATYCAICPTALVVVGGVSYHRPDCYSFIRGYLKVDEKETKICLKC